MKTNKLIEIIKKGNFVVPLYIFQIKDKIKLKAKENINDLSSFINNFNVLNDIEIMNKALNVYKERRKNTPSPKYSKIKKFNQINSIISNSII